MRYNKNKSKLSIATKPSRNLTVSKFNKGINAKLAYSVLDFDVAQFAYNFDFDSGVLTEGIGVSNSDIVEQQPLENGVM
ncbi:MAG: hypothetical protein FWF58_00445, partial [Firmicutes bacterium]|nr:hypothetical protein [Bacillota bacterium]